jgi:hypothetical protein
MSNMERFYRDEPTREREVALYIDGRYATRGPASAGERTARYGWPGGDEVVAPERLSWELDRFTGLFDRPCLCWGNEKLTSAQFLAWLRESSRT